MTCPSCDPRAHTHVCVHQPLLRLLCWLAYANYVFRLMHTTCQHVRGCAATAPHNARHRGLWLELMVCRTLSWCGVACCHSKKHQSGCRRPPTHTTPWSVVPLTHAPAAGVHFPPRPATARRGVWRPRLVTSQHWGTAIKCVCWCGAWLGVVTHFTAAWDVIYGGGNRQGDGLNSLAGTGHKVALFCKGARAWAV